MAVYTAYVGIDGDELGWAIPVVWYLGKNAGFTYNTTSPQSQMYSTSSSVTLAANEYPISIKIESYNSHKAYIHNRYPARETQVYNNTSGQYDTVYSPWDQYSTFSLGTPDRSITVPFLDLGLPDTHYNYAGSFYYFDNSAHEWSINGQSLMGQTLCLVKTGPSDGLVLGNRAKVTITTQTTGGRVSVQQTYGGTVSVNGTTFSAGATVTCTVTPQSYYRLSSVQLTPLTNSLTMTDTGFTFVMPNPARDFVITPHFAYHEIIWDQPALTAEQQGREIYVTKSGTATDTWNESFVIRLMVGDVVAAQFTGDTVVLTDDYFTPGEVVNLRLVAAGSSVVSLGASMNFTTVDDLGVANYYDGSGYQKSYIRRYNGTAWENVI